MNCKFEGCGKASRDLGYCTVHAKRYRRYGDANYVTPEQKRRVSNREAQLKLATAKSTTYLKYFGRHEHRAVAENKLGRPLKRGEIVHHLDGNKHNNHPDNLEVMTQADHIRLHRADMKKKKPNACPRGHAYSGPNLRIDKKGSSVCRTCARAANKAWKLKQCQ